MGEVYRARDTRLDRTVAIKILPPGSSTPSRTQRFDREARAVSKFNHPHICTLYDIGDRTASSSSSWSTSREKRWRIGSDAARCPWTRSLRDAIEIADALAHAHRQGIVHRDLKPANVMLTAAGAKLSISGSRRCMSRRCRIHATPFGHRSRNPDRGRHVRRHASVHRSGATRSTADGRPCRHLRVWRHRLRDGDRAAGVQRDQQGQHHCGCARARSGAAVGRSPEDRRGPPGHVGRPAADAVDARPDRRQVPREGSR